jgi:hypothetical protein
MDHSVPFNLPEFMFSHFCGVDFGGNLFAQWPVGIRFEIGIKQVFRAAKLYEFAFAKTEDCILVSQDWEPNRRLPEHCSSLFDTPGIFPTEPSRFQEVEVTPFDETPYRLTWTRLSPLAFDSAQMFQAIANREQDGVPKVVSGVYVIDPLSKIIMHMYDDRGLDIIAAELDSLRPMFGTFSDWILDFERHRVEFRFRSNSAKFSEERA